MFGIIDHLLGAVLVRIRLNLFALLRKPDTSYIDNNVAIGGHCSVQSLVKSGFGCILDVRKEDHDNQKQLENFSISYLRIPISDRTIPTRLQAIQALIWIRENISKDKKVFVHCNLGRGRAPTIACLYLLSKGMSVDDVLKTVKKQRRYTYFNKSQIKFIREFSSYTK